MNIDVILGLVLGIPLGILIHKRHLVIKAKHALSVETLRYHDLEDNDLQRLERVSFGDPRLDAIHQDQLDVARGSQKARKGEFNLGHRALNIALESMFLPYRLVYIAKENAVRYQVDEMENLRLDQEDRLHHNPVL